MRWPLTAFAILVLSATADACTFCSGGAAGQSTLREQFHAAGRVLVGTLQNPKADASGIAGTTEFRVEESLKPGVAEGPKTIVLKRYYPDAAQNPPRLVLFFPANRDEPTAGLPATPAAVDYLKAAAKFDAKNPAARLAFAFKHLDHADPTANADAFLEFAKASDAEILTAKSSLDPAKLAAWLADPKLPAERIGVYALLLGLCGRKADAAVLDALLTATPRPERVSGNLGGILAGYALLDADGGWKRIAAAVSSGRPPHEELAAIGTIRFFQATRPEAKPQILAAYKPIVRGGSLADLAIDDLRRWGWWDLSEDAFAAYSAASAPVLRRGIVRYAIACPTSEAKAFLAGVRAKDPKLVAAVEESVRLYGDR